MGILYLKSMSSQGFVPESFLKKQEREKKAADQMKVRREERRTQMKKNRDAWRQRAEKYFQANVQREQNIINERRTARNTGSFYVPPEAKVAFVIRLKGINKIRPQVKAILRLFRLRQINNGVFVKVNKATMNMLRRIEPYVAHGFPNRKTISDLIYKRGFVRVNRARIPITDNAIIAQNLGKFGINCVEDLIEEVFQVNAHFKEANNFLWPFKLNNPRGGWRNKNHPFQRDGDWGNREEEINGLFRSML